MIDVPHTPGPWRFDDEQAAILSADWKPVAFVSFHAADSLAQEAANGRLMAAAPLLLRAARHALVELTLPGDAQDPGDMLALIVRDLREAIASAGYTATPTEPPPGA